jgi:hypothetical protein
LNLRAPFLVLSFALAGCGGGSSSTGTAGAAGGASDSAALYASLRTGGKLILHQRAVAQSVSPAQLKARAAGADATLDAFDGVFLRLPATTDAVMRNAVLDPAVVAADLAPLAGLQPVHLRHNFALVTAQHDLDAFDDWSVVLRNFGTLARAVRDAGLVGIVIDNEAASGLRVAYPDDVRFPSLTLADYRTQTRAIGKKIMQALAADFPDIAVVVLRGPAAAEAMTPPQLVVRAVDSAPLLGPFFAGFVEGKGARALLVDGGADYGLRIDDQFADSHDWRKNGIASAQTASPFIDPALGAIWPGVVSVAFGVREIDGSRADRLPSRVPVWENTVAAALRHSDALVWASFDTTDMSQAGAADPWVVAARRAKAAGTTGARLASLGAATGTGLIGQYFVTPDQIDLAETTIDALIDYDWTEFGPTTTSFGQQANYSVVWSGYLEAPVSGTYTIFSTTDDGMRVTIGGVRVIDAFFDQGPTEYSVAIDMLAGFRYPIKVEYFQHGGLARATVEWQPPGMPREAIPPQRLYPVN